MLINGGIGVGKTAFLKDLKIRREKEKDFVIYFNMNNPNY